MRKVLLLSLVAIVLFNTLEELGYIAKPPETYPSMEPKLELEPFKDTLPEYRPRFLWKEIPGEYVDPNSPQFEPDSLAFDPISIEQYKDY